MPTVTAITNPVRLRLLCPPTSAALAAPLLSRHLSITVAEAMHRLARGPGPLAERLSRPHAERLAALLQTLGMRVEIESQHANATPRQIDLSLQPSHGSDLRRLARGLALTLNLSEQRVLHDLRQPGGVILRAPDAGLVDRLRRAMRRLTGLQIATSARESAILDLFPRTPTQSRALMRHLNLLGLTACPFNGALASGLDAKMVDHLTLRFGDQVVGLERAFQRLDLYLTGPGTMPPMDLADFLATRRHGTGQIETLSPTVPLRIETGLSYAAALQFQTDYEMIGLHTVANLTRSGTAKESR